MQQKLLALFESCDGFVSGERLSRELNCSRTAVWKQIEKLRREGYTFEAVSRLGYRLTAKPERLELTKLTTSLSTKLLGRSIRLLDEVASTQNEAHLWVANGAQEGSLIVAERQTAGRGRMGRSWHSPKGKGLWLSIIMKPSIPLPYTPQLTLLIAVALCRTIRLHTSIPAGIKWPNDILINDRKLSGILLESSAEDERLRYVIAGIGIGVNLVKEDYPEEIQPIVTSLLIETGRSWDRTELLCAFLGQLEELYDLYLTQGFSPIRTLWEAHSVSLGRSVRVTTPNGTLEGTALSIDEMGALLVRLPSGEITRVFSGEVNNATS
jgi:BirA family biotin operon repressor/biotin-[acetyl-CoA-carboxylase] ligase